jgi:hypothetical protein
MKRNYHLTDSQREFLQNQFDKFPANLSDSEEKDIACGLLGGHAYMSQKEMQRYCTMEGIQQQLDKFEGPAGGFVFYALVERPNCYTFGKLLVNTYTS